MVDEGCLGAIFSTVGAFVRYRICKLFGSKKNFEYHIDNIEWLNTVIGLIVVGLIVFIVVRIIQYFGR